MERKRRDFYLNIATIVLGSLSIFYWVNHPGRVVSALRQIKTGLVDPTEIPVWFIAVWCIALPGLYIWLVLSPGTRSVLGAFVTWFFQLPDRVRKFLTRKRGI